jgi:hypothetical protein
MGFEFKVITERELFEWDLLEEETTETIKMQRNIVYGE